MADVKTLTVHGIPYSIKDETARNNIRTLQSTVSGHTSNLSSIEEDVSTLQSTVSGHTTKISSIEGEIDTLQSTVSEHTTKISSIEGEIDTLQSTVSEHTTKISSIEGEIDTLQSTVSEHTSSISSINSTLSTKITGDWFFANNVPQTDIPVPQTPAFADLFANGFNNTIGGAYLITVTGLLFQGGQGNIEVVATIDGQDTQIGNIPTGENLLLWGSCAGIVAFPPGNHIIKIRARASHAPAIAKAYSGIFVTLIKVKN